MLPQGQVSLGALVWPWVLETVGLRQEVRRPAPGRCRLSISYISLKLIIGPHIVATLFKSVIGGLALVGVTHALTEYFLRGHVVTTLDERIIHFANLVVVCHDVVLLCGGVIHVSGVGFGRVSCFLLLGGRAFGSTATRCARGVRGFGFLRFLVSAVLFGIRDSGILGAELMLVAMLVPCGELVLIGAVVSGRRA